MEVFTTYDADATSGSVAVEAAGLACLADAAGSGGVPAAAVGTWARRAARV